MSFLDRLRTERHTLEEGQREAQQKRKEAELQRRKDEQLAKDTQSRQVETNKKLYRSAYKYYTQSGCDTYLLEIVSQLQRQRLFLSLLSSQKPEEYDNRRYKEMPDVFRIPTMVSKGIVWKVSQENMPAEKAAALVDSLDVTRFGSVYKSREAFFRQLTYQHADYFSVRYERDIWIEMSANGEMTVRGKTTSTLVAADWQQDKSVIDRAIEMAMSEPRTLASVTPECNCISHGNYSIGE